jgi:hypothetical protein
MDLIHDPNDLVRLVLEQFFGRASWVVFAWVLITASVAWITLGRQAVNIKAITLRYFSVLTDDYSLKSGKAKATLGLAATWCIFYGIASLVTQLWAGSQFSKGQGNELAELLT